MNFPAVPSLLARAAALAFTASCLLAQSPLTTTFTGTANTTLAGACYFDLLVQNPAGLTVTALDFHSGSAFGQHGFVTVHTISGSYLGNTGDSTNWTEHATVPVTSSGPGAVSHAFVEDGIYLSPGLHGIAVAVAGVSERYTPGSGCVSSSVPGSCVNSVFQNADLQLRAGGTSSAPFVLPTVSPRVWNGGIHYRVGNTSVAAASAQPFGLGTYASGYQFFADAVEASAALQGNSMQFTPANGSYRMSWGGGTLLGLPLTATPVFAQPTDDGSAAVALPGAFPTPAGPVTSVEVNSNGILAFGGSGTLTWGSSPSFVPNPDVFLDRNRTAIYSWADYNESEAGSGRIMQSTTFVGFDQVVCITWNDVEHWSATPLQNRSTLQFQLNMTTGAITLVWQHVDTDTSSSWGTAQLVGFSPAGANANGGSLRLANDLPLTLAAVDSGTRCSSNLPLLGSTWNVASSDHVAGWPIGLVMFGSSAFPGPGVDLAAAGAPGGRAYQNGDLGAFVFTVPGGQGTHAVFVPFEPALFGTTLFAQTIGFTSQNSLAMAPSNGLAARLGW